MDPRAAHGLHLPDVRPLDHVRSIKTKLGVLVGATVTVSSLLVWAGLHNQIGPRYTLPAAIVVALVVTQVLARGMTSPLREMTSVARSMATGDYSRRVRATSSDEVGQLAHAFNRMADDLASVDRQRRELVANVSHELRTPVAALHAQLENLVDGVTAADAETLQAALEQTGRLGHLVSQLLDLSRLEAGAVPLEPSDLALQPFLDDAVRSARLVAEGAGRDVEFRLDVQPADLSVRADGPRLHQVVANLLDNASRHSPTGGTVEVLARPTDREMLAIEVVDEGPGIAPTERERVFERFHRGPSSGGGGGADGGTGLGLAIARWAIGLHGGTIEVADPPSSDGTGRGCRIRVLLPRRTDTRLH